MVRPAGRIHSVVPVLGPPGKGKVEVDPALAGVVGGQRVADVASVVRQQPAQVAHATAQVLGGIKGLAHIETLGGVGNQGIRPMAAWGDWEPV